ncbi:LOW QUALITY PROTEIN: hypothetical protein NC653_016694 [Populus alba x Populus x berolinensis]|uniref:Cell growth-regulating nucleolar protein-like winged helix domain-containing protein n=1 Tax=Populus alba x Populus x berolinensis TaxID=444605 RepID=A0AAD6QNJ0_9ROSI|nr:LOW QUALITY PROTEIN: hypothetical protein NC653_016694 [Populus alba x Populus x berolinensis]
MTLQEASSGAIGWGFACIGSLVVKISAIPRLPVKQALLLHADGKKHRGKAGVFKLPSNNLNRQKNLLLIQMRSKKLQDTPSVDSADTNTEIENGKLPSKRKRKVDASGSDGTGNKTKDGAANEVGNSQVETRKSDDVETQLKKAKHNALKDDKATSPKKEDNKKNIKKLKTLVQRSLQESGIAKNETELDNILEQKINSSSRFRVDDKYVHLATKD